MAKTFKSEIVDDVILTLESIAKIKGKHLLKTDTICRMIGSQIDLTDDIPERRELLDIGIRQVIQSRLYAHNYYSVETGYFVNIDNCENLSYLKMIIDNKDEGIKVHVKARNRILEIKGLNGQACFVPDEHNELKIVYSQTKEELIEDLETDAV